jgi:DNA-binding response OmpR family regulator
MENPILQRPDDALGPRRVLLAEDDTRMRAMLARALQTEGFEVIEAASGDEALEALASAIIARPIEWFDLVISDVRMPAFDGLNILASLRRLPSTVPVILITAFGTADDHASALRLGAFAMLDKPFDLDFLLAMAHAAVLDPTKRNEA